MRMTQPSIRNGLARSAWGTVAVRIGGATLVASMAMLCCLSVRAEKHYGPGVTDTEIKIGQTMPYSGPLSAFGTM